MRAAAPDIFSYRQHWAKRFGVAPQLPMSRAEMDALGWDACDVVLVTGDAYVDHPSFGMALIGRLLEAQGFRVGILAQPRWQSAEDFARLGQPKLFFGVTGGNMDSMVNRYTSDRRIRSNDAYTPEGAPHQRPDRCVLVYAQRCREAFAEVPIVLGGIEASLRRVAHYDYWSEKVRRSVLLDAKADLLVYGNGERQVVALAHRLAAGQRISALDDIRGTAFVRSSLPTDWTVLDATRADAPSARALPADAARSALRLPSFEQLRDDRVLYAHASRTLHRETNPGNARALVQAHGDRLLWLNPPPLPLTTKEMDGVYGLPYSRRPHRSYGHAKIPAFEMIQHSVTIMRGCFGGCSFCSITEHEGRVIQSRSQQSILREIEAIRDTSPAFTGVISDLGGPTANMYRLGCKDPAVEASCRRPSCVYPVICKNLDTDHSALIGLYRQARALPGVKKILVASGLRYDLAVRSPEYVRELATHHVGGYLKIAPEHTEAGPLSKMMKPGIGSYDRFKELFDRYSQQADKEQYLIPYFIAAHPGTTDEDMLALALWLKQHGFRADQVQAFLPSPMATATAMYHSGKNPLHPVGRDTEEVSVPKSLKQRRLHKAFLRYHDPENWPLLRAALLRMGRGELIGKAKHCLIPLHQPAGTGTAGEGRRRGLRPRPAGPFKTQHTGLPTTPASPTSPQARRGAPAAAKPRRAP
ncbi:MAG: YgiQ family radical SAM protein [Proteobacteria bacterium]|nr:YgiQ family radical SAM protein [Pseudomonadota bacterium]